MEILLTMVKVSVNSSDIFSDCVIVCEKQTKTHQHHSSRPLYCGCDKAPCSKATWRGDSLCQLVREAMAGAKQEVKQKPQRKAFYSFLLLTSQLFLTETTPLLALSRLYQVDN